MKNKILVLDIAKKGVGFVLAGAIIIATVVNVPYKVPTDEVATIYTMGVQGKQVSGGLHFKVPFIQSIKKTKNPMAIIPIYIGYRDKGKQQYETVSSEAYMLTGDEKILDVEWLVELQVSDSNKAMYKSLEPVSIIRDIALTNMRKVINSLSMEFAISGGREQISSAVGKSLDAELKQMDLGYSIKKIQIQDLQPPSQIAASYKLVNDAKLKNSEQMSAAKSEQAKDENQAKSDVAKIKADADGEKDRIITAAKGETADFFSMYDLYKLNKDATKRQMLTNALTKLMPKAKVYITNDNTVNYMNLQQIPVQAQPQAQQPAGK